MGVLDNRHVLFTNTGMGGQPDALPVPFSVERVGNGQNDQIHVVVGDARAVFDSDHFLEILRKLQWSVVIDRGLVRPGA